ALPHEQAPGEPAGLGRGHPGGQGIYSRAGLRPEVRREAAGPGDPALRREPALQPHHRRRVRPRRHRRRGPRRRRRNRAYLREEGSRRPAV
ncbi:MAG: ClpB protein, partial [uncultured Rubrobacteraceae bacterium]